MKQPEFDESLEKAFHHAMLGIYEQARDACDYRAVRFLQMVSDRGGLETAKRLLAQEEIQAGLTTLWECQRLDLSMEALVLEPRFKLLFNESELKTARERLDAFGYRG